MATTGEVQITVDSVLAYCKIVGTIFPFSIMVVTHIFSEVNIFVQYNTYNNTYDLTNNRWNIRIK